MKVRWHRSTDATMQKLWLCMERDAKSALDILPISHRLSTACRTADWARFREVRIEPHFSTENPYSVKWVLQLRDMFKRYKFENDCYSTEQLESMAHEKFLRDQMRISQPKELCPCDFLVLQEARRIASDILGKYDGGKHANLCKFSTHANTGVLYRDSYLETKLTVLSGTDGQIRWFEKHLSTDDCLHRAVLSCCHRGDAAEWTVSPNLSLAKVPKSWKSLRTMLPNTVIGSFYSHGLGDYVRNQLMDAGVDIRRLQDRHKILARKFSRSRTHVTADLSSASDSFSRALLRRLLPAAWYKAVVRDLPRYCIIEGSNYSLQSVMTMGMGHTFPLQTLLFRCILKAVQNLTGVTGIISVYGDDLIYPTRMHAYVKVILPRLGFLLNLDKTSVSSHFRESCGGDYYQGLDVRPFQPEGVSSRLSRAAYTAFLYKLYNGLLLRWSEFEIPQTLHMLITELVNVNDTVFQVPPSFPEISGIRVSTPQRPGIIPWSPVKYPVEKRAACACVFRYLTNVGENRIIQNERPYMWNALRLLEHGAPWSPYSTSVETLIYLKQRTKKGKVRMVLAEPSRAGTRPVSQTTSTSSWS